MNGTFGTDNKPCSVKARQGFSVYYRNRYLYSQYDAEKSVLRLVDSLSIRPETLVLAYSPVLGTGLRNLLKRLPADCSVLAVEFDRELFDFFMDSETAEAVCHDPRFKAVLLERPEQIAALISQGKYRRCLPVEMSGGTAFFQEEYRLTTKYADDAIATFWKNHITLSKLGRLYAGNLLENCSHIKDTKRLVAHSVTKTILALGAGPSLDELLPKLHDARDSFFILAADAALSALSQYDLTPDAVVAVESQLAIEKAYIGFEGSGIPLIADMTSRPHVLSIMKGPVSFFMTEYCTEPFLERFRKLAQDNGIPVFQPLGSVGLYAVELALFLRAPGTPVCFSGLDFAWNNGITHCKGSPAHTNMLLNTSRLLPAGNPVASFGAGTSSFEGKAGRKGYTTPNLAGYGAILTARYKGTPFLFDAGTTGMETGIQAISVENMLSDAKKRAETALSAENGISIWDEADARVSGPYYERGADEARSGCAADSTSEDEFLKREYAGIMQIIELIDKFDFLNENDGNKLLELLKTHSYLYLHFPDSSRGPVLTRDFLVRVRMEAIRFLPA